MSYTIWPDGNDGDALQDIYRERLRQEDLKAEGKFEKTCADEMPNVECLAVLAEEFGEVAKHVTEELIDSARLDPVKLREELVQVAAVCCGWASRLPRK